MCQNDLMQVKASSVMMQEVVTVARIQKCQRLRMVARRETKGRVAAPVGALGCLAVRASVLPGGAHIDAQTTWLIVNTLPLVAV